MPGVIHELPHDTASVTIDEVRLFRRRTIGADIGVASNGLSEAWTCSGATHLARAGGPLADRRPAGVAVDWVRGLAKRLAPVASADENSDSRKASPYVRTPRDRRTRQGRPPKHAERRGD